MAEVLMIPENILQKVLSGSESTLGLSGRDILLLPSPIILDQFFIVFSLDILMLTLSVE